MDEKPPMLSYAGKTTPGDSRRARRLIAFGLILVLTGILFIFWLASQPHIDTGTGGIK